MEHCLTALKPFWFSTEHCLTALKPFWLLANDISCLVIFQFFILLYIIPDRPSSAPSMQCCHPIHRFIWSRWPSEGSQPLTSPPWIARQNRWHWKRSTSTMCTTALRHTSATHATRPGHGWRNSCLSWSLVALLQMLVRLHATSCHLLLCWHIYKNSSRCYYSLLGQKKNCYVALSRPTVKCEKTGSGFFFFFNVRFGQRIC